MVAAGAIISMVVIGSVVAVTMVIGIITKGKRFHKRDVWKEKQTGVKKKKVYIYDGFKCTLFYSFY